MRGVLRMLALVYLQHHLRLQLEIMVHINIHTSREQRKTMACVHLRGGGGGGGGGSARRRRRYVSSCSEALVLRAVGMDKRDVRGDGACVFSHTVTTKPCVPVCVCVAKEQRGKEGV